MEFNSGFKGLKMSITLQHRMLVFRTILSINIAHFHKYHLTTGL